MTMIFWMLLAAAAGAGAADRPPNPRLSRDFTQVVGAVAGEWNPQPQAREDIQPAEIPPVGGPTIVPSGLEGAARGSGAPGAVAPALVKALTEHLLQHGGEDIRVRGYGPGEAFCVHGSDALPAPGSRVSGVRDTEIIWACIERLGDKDGHLVATGDIVLDVLIVDSISGMRLSTRTDGSGRIVSARRRIQDHRSPEERNSELPPIEAQSLWIEFARKALTLGARRPA